MFTFLQEPIFVPDPVISLAVEAKNKVKTNTVKSQLERFSIDSRK